MVAEDPSSSLSNRPVQDSGFSHGPPISPRLFDPSTNATAPGQSYRLDIGEFAISSERPKLR